MCNFWFGGHLSLKLYTLTEMSRLLHVTVHILAYLWQYPWFHPHLFESEHISSFFQVEPKFNQKQIH